MIHNRKKLINWISSKFKEISSKDATKTIKRQVIDQEEIFAKHVFDKRFVSKIYNEFVESIMTLTSQ